MRLSAGFTAGARDFADRQVQIMVGSRCHNDGFGMTIEPGLHTGTCIHEDRFIRYPILEASVAIHEILPTNRLDIRRNFVLIRATSLQQ